MTDKPFLAIKMNRYEHPMPCALCDRPTIPAEGPELFLVERWELVCWDCGQKIAPELVELLTTRRALRTPPPPE